MSDKRKNELALKDPKLLALVWNKESVYFAWTRIFSTASTPYLLLCPSDVCHADILGDFNRFRSAENYEVAMQTMNEVVEMLFEAQDQLAWDGTSSYSLLSCLSCLGRALSSL